MTEPTQQLPRPEPAPRHRGWLWLFGVGAAVVVVAGLGVVMVVQGSHASTAQVSSSTTNGPTSDRHPGHSGHAAKDTFTDPFHLGRDETLLIGTLSSVQSGKLTVARDGGGDVAVTTDADTKARGVGVRTVSDLTQGRRIVVKVRDGVARDVLVPPGHAAGTLTSVDGDSAVLKQADGLQVALDLSGVRDKPKAGAVVLVTGSSVSDGKAMKVENVRELPRAGG